MFFVLSKILGFFASPSNILIALGLVGAALTCTRFVRVGVRLATLSLVLLAIFGLSPAGNVLILPLEERFPPWDPSRGAPDGIVVLGGAIYIDLFVSPGTAVFFDEAGAPLVGGPLAP